MENSRAAALLETLGWVGDAIMSQPTLNWSIGDIPERDHQRWNADVV